MRIKNCIKKLYRRLVSEEAGAVAMEYVIIGLLVAAAAVAAITYFGRSVSSGMNTMSVAVTGDHAKAGQMSDTASEEAIEGVKSAEESRNKFHTDADSKIGSSGE